MHELADEQVPGRAVHDVERHACGQRAAADLDGIEMCRQQQHATPRGARRLEVLEPGHHGDAADAFVRRPPAHGGFEQRAPEAREVLAQDAGARFGNEFRQRQLEVAGRDPLE